MSKDPLERGRRVMSETPVGPLGPYYVGVGRDIERPGIVSGPFDHDPGLLARHTLYTKLEDGTWIWVRSNNTDQNEPSKSPLPMTTPAVTRTERIRSLRRELNTLEAEEKAEREAKERQQSLVWLKHLDALLECFATEHNYSTCSDTNLRNKGECQRCTLLDIKANAEWNEWPRNVLLGLQLTVRPEEENMER